MVSSFSKTISSQWLGNNLLQKIFFYSVRVYIYKKVVITFEIMNN